MSKLDYTGFMQVKKQKLIGVRPLLRATFTWMGTQNKAHVVLLAAEMVLDRLDAEVHR